MVIHLFMNIQTTVQENIIYLKLNETKKYKVRPLTFCMIYSYNRFKVYLTPDLFQGYYPFNYFDGISNIHSFLLHKAKIPIPLSFASQPQTRNITRQQSAGVITLEHSSCQRLKYKNISPCL